jgi:hypothetical protein
LALGCRFIGIDVSEQYLALARRRLADHHGRVATEGNDAPLPKASRARRAS